MIDTLGNLIECYRTDHHSSFLKLSHSVRVRHERLLSRITREHGTCALKKIRSRDLLTWHQGWLGDGKIAAAHSLMSRLRVIFRFGATVLEDEECRRLADTLDKMKFERSNPRTSALSHEQALLLRTRAREHFGWYSIALAQAFQFDLRLSQKAVIGEWVSGQVGKAIATRVVGGVEQSWGEGLLWSDIDDDFILHHVDRRGQKRNFDLASAPMVMEELAIYAGTSGVELKRASLPAHGPLIICDTNGLPWSTAEFRRKWRLVATNAGVPKHVMNMDSIRPDALGQNH